MIDSHLRTYYQKHFVNPLLPHLAKHKLSPSSFTFAALISGLLLIPAIAAGCTTLSLFLLLLSGYLDTVDGSLARFTHTASDQGAMLDIVSDRAVESSIIMGLFLLQSDSRGLLSILMLASILICVTSFLVVGIFINRADEKSFYYSSGLMERTEAFLFFSLMILFPSLFSFLASAFIILVLFTALKRLWEFSFHGANDH